MGAFSTFLFAQTPKENLEKAVEEYNSFKTFAHGLTTSTIKSEDVEAGQKRLNAGIEKLEKVIREGSSAEIKAARYFKANFQYEQFFLLGIIGQNREAAAMQDLFADEIMGFKPTDFPIRYAFFDKNFVIEWANFASTQAEFLTSAGEILYIVGRFSEATKLTKKAIEHSDVAPFSRYVALNKLLDIHQKEPSTLSPSEKLDIALRTVRAYDGLDEEYKNVVKDHDYPTTLRGAAILNESPDLSATGLERMAEAAPIAFKYEKSRPEAARLYKKVYEKRGSGGDAAFHRQALADAKMLFSTSKTDAQSIGGAAIIALKPKTEPSDCSIYRELAEASGAIGAFAEKTKMEAFFQDCSKKKAAAAEKVAADARKAAKKANRNFSMYIGLDVIPLVKNAVEDMDWGGHLDLCGRRVAHSFGFSKVQNRKDLNSGAAKWDGRRFFYSPKIFSKDNENFYVGPFFGYAEKNFEPQTNSTVAASDGSFQTLTLTPLDKQYEALLNFGFKSGTVLGFGMDFWMGLGGSYHQLTYKELPNASDFALSGNEFFNDRPPKQILHLQLRMGVSVGLNIGKKRN